jgi:hypothetical protein
MKIPAAQRRRKSPMGKANPMFFPQKMPFEDKVREYIALVLTYLTHQVSAGPEPAGS